MISEPMPSWLLCALLPMIEPRWRARADIVQVIGSREGGGWWTSSEIADCVGRNPGHLRKILAQLVEDRVILRDGGAAGGGRRFWVEVNPEWAQWRVPWRFPGRIVRQRVAWVRHDASIGALGRFIAHPYGARYPEISALLIGRDTALREAVRTDLSRPIGMRDNQSSTEAYRASETGSGRDRGGSSRIPMGRDKSGPTRKREKESFQSARTREVDTSFSEAAGVDTGELEQVRQAVLGRCLGPSGRGPYLAGDPLRRLAELVERYGAPSVIAATEQIPPNTEMVPAFLDVLAQVLDRAATPARLEADAEEGPAAVYTCKKCGGEFAHADQLAGEECWGCVDAAPGARPAPTIVGRPTRDPTIRDGGSTDSEETTGKSTRMRVRSPR